MDHPASVFGNDVVLELKFTNRFPDWFKELARVFGLMQCGAAKYVDGVTVFGQDRVNRAFVLDAEDNGDPVGAVNKVQPHD
jgi:hypothetical protein